MAWFADPNAKKRGITHELNEHREAQDDFNLHVQGQQNLFNRTMNPALTEVNNAGATAANAVSNYGSNANTNLTQVGNQANQDLTALNTDNASGYASNWFNPMAQAMQDQARNQVQASAGASLFGTGTMQKISDQTAAMAGQFWNDAIKAGQQQNQMNASNIAQGANIESGNITQGANLGMTGETQGQNIRQQGFENTAGVAGQNLQTGLDTANTNLGLDIDQANLEGQRAGQNNSIPRWFM